VLYTSFAQLREADACQSRYRHLRSVLSKDVYRDETPIPLVEILDANGLDDALWSLRVCGEDVVSFIREYALRCAVHVGHIGGEDARACNAVTRRYLDGEATCEELVLAKAAWERAMVAWKTKPLWEQLACWAADAAAAPWAADAERASYAAGASDVMQCGVSWATDAAAGAGEDAEVAWQTDTLRKMLVAEAAED